MRHGLEFSEFCAAAWPKLVGALGHHFGDAALGEELAQEALVKAAQRWDHVRECASPHAWVFRVGVNAGNSMFRRSAAEKRALNRVTNRRDEGEDTIDVVTRLQMRSALAALNPSQRQVLIARYYLDLSVTEVSGEFGLTPGAVRALTFRAMQTVRSRLLLQDTNASEVEDVC